MFRKLILTLIMTISLFLTNCFEYEEVIKFNKDLSGILEITYIVPLKKNKKDSMIQSLPTGKSEILSYLNRGLLTKKITIENYQFQLIESNTDTLKFKYKGKVHYKVSFLKLSEIENALIGITQIKQSENSIGVFREFRSIKKIPDQTSSTGERKIYNETIRLIKNATINFQVFYPLESICSSTKGTVQLGNIHYKFPVIETLENDRNRLWNFKIQTIL